MSVAFVAAVAVGGAACAAAVLALGAWRWRAGTRRLRRTIESARLPHATRRVDFAAIASLPPPVRRYFETALSDGQPIVAAANLEHAGTFDAGAKAPEWRRFTSTQRVVTRARGFDWDAKIAVFPGVAVRVHDAYVEGDGFLHASVAGLVTVAHLQGAGDIARGELLRFVAEAAWYPTALLPGEGVRWEAIDARSARATVRDRDVEASLVFGFADDGSIDTVYAEARGRTVGRDIVPTPWRGRFWNAVRRDGMLVPLDGEVSWLLAEGARPYWRGHVASIAYEYEA